MTGFRQTQPIIIDDFIKIEEDVQSQGQSKLSRLRKRKNKPKHKGKQKYYIMRRIISHKRRSKCFKKLNRKRKYTRYQLQKEIDKTSLSETRNKKKSQKALSIYNVQFRERNKSMKKEWSQMSADQKELYLDKPNIDLSFILNQTKEIYKHQKQDEIILATLRNESKEERLIPNHIQSGNDEPQNICYRYEPDKQFI